MTRLDVLQKSFKGPNMAALIEYRLTASGHDLYSVLGFFFFTALIAMGERVASQRQGPTL